MLATFCLRLALGMLAALLLLSPKQMHPRFFRTHFLTALGLSVVALILHWESSATWVTAIACTLAFSGAVVWTFERSLLGWTLIGLTLVSLAMALLLNTPLQSGTQFLEPTREFSHIPSFYSRLTRTEGRLANDLTAAALLGFSMTAMLAGHSYLISPGLTIKPLMRQLAALGIALVLRVAVAATALWFWTADHDLTNLNDETVLWLPVRWLIGLGGPLVFGWMAYRTAKIRSTQSATGILYVVVILTFLGELTSLLLLRSTGLPL